MKTCKIGILVQLGFIHLMVLGVTINVGWFWLIFKILYIHCKSKIFNLLLNVTLYLGQLHYKNCMKPSWTKIPILHFLYLGFCMLYCQKCEITPILHCKIKLCFCNFFQLLMGSMYQNHNIYHQTGYIQHVKWVLSRNIAI